MLVVYYEHYFFKKIQVSFTAIYLRMHGALLNNSYNNNPMPWKYYHAEHTVYAHYSLDAAMYMKMIHKGQETASA